MTKEEKDIIKKAMVNARNSWALDCDRRIAEEHGKIIGADYMLQRFLESISDKDSKAAADESILIE